jgi:hypothetical protein
MGRDKATPKQIILTPVRDYLRKILPRKKQHSDKKKKRKLRQRALRVVPVPSPLHNDTLSCAHVPSIDPPDSGIFIYTSDGLQFLTLDDIAYNNNYTLTPAKRRYQKLLQNTYRGGPSPWAHYVSLDYTFFT